MKGNNRKQAGIKKAKQKKSGAKNSNRAHLHANNHHYNEYARTHKFQTQLPGYPQGKHVAKDPTCRCGGCSTKEVV